MFKLSGKRVLITGTNGFVGANLARELLAHEADIHAIIRSGSTLWRINDILPCLTLHEADLNDYDLLARVVKQVSPEVIFHLAVPGGHPQSQPERKELMRTAVIGTSYLLESTAEIDYYRFVYMCSSTAYGPRLYPLIETDSLQPSTFRGAAKASSAILCQQHAREYNRPLVILRPFSIYGYWESASRLIPSAILATLRGKELALTVPGFRRDLVFISDVLQACLLALEADELSGEVINIGTGSQWSNEAVVELVQSLSGRKLQVRTGAYPSQPSDTTCWVADVQKAKKTLGWEPTHTLPEGLQKTISWFERNLDLYER